MVLKLTRNQMKQLKPLFDKVERAYKRGAKGAIIMQPFGKEEVIARYNGTLFAAFLKYELAIQVFDLLQANKSQIVKR